MVYIDIDIDMYIYIYTVNIESDIGSSISLFLVVHRLIFSVIHMYYTYNVNFTRHWRFKLKAHNDKGIRATRMGIETKKYGDTDKQTKTRERV